MPGADPGGVQGVRTPAFLIRVPFFETNSVSKYHRECIKTHHFDIRNTKIFRGEGTVPLGPTPSAPDLRCPFQMDWTPALVKS